MLLAALAGALAWSPPTAAVEADADTSRTPSDEFVYHTVERGESVWEIADRYGTSVTRLIRENQIEDPNEIWVGARLRIPLPVGTGPTLRAEEKVNARGPETTDIAALLDRCDAELRAARFERALASAGEARKRIDAQNDTGGDSLRVRLEIASATAHVALGQNDAALENLERALIADPGLELDPALTSPKVLAIFRVARRRASRRR
jgi:LysM repeat protein